MAADLRGGIRSGQYPPGSRLPTKAVLMAVYKKRWGRASLGTVNKALGELRQEGLIESQRGVGVFVVDVLPDLDTPSEFDQLRALIEELANKVRNLEGRLDRAGVVP
jgi:DNA-binding GntR family transcriptional regulator